MPKEKGPEWNYVAVQTNVQTYALCTFTSCLQTFTIFFQINAFFNVYYNFFNVYHIYDPRYISQELGYHSGIIWYHFHEEIVTYDQTDVMRWIQRTWYTLV